MKARSSGGLTVRTETGATIQNGVIDTSRVGKFSNIGDEPAGLLGTDTGMSPTEYIMQALAGCYTATLTMMAAEKGIDLDGIEPYEQDRQSRGVRSAGQRNAKEFANPRYSG